MPPEDTGKTCFEALPVDSLLAELDTSHQGLATDEAARRLRAVRRERPGGQLARAAGVFAGQFYSPISLILIAAALVSLFLLNVTDAVIILLIVLAGAVLGAWQEFSAANAMSALMALVNPTVTVLRDGQPAELPAQVIVRGDVVLLAAGSSIPGDCRLLEATDLFVNESALTGESFPVEKSAGTVPPHVPLAERRNALYLGTHVVSGTGRALVVGTGAETQLGQMRHRLQLRPPETDFERGIRLFGMMLLELTLFLTLGIFVIHLAMRQPALEALMFSLALAVGLTPQLLPAVVTVNLAHGARRLAMREVIVRRLQSIENLGSMNVLCCDKTGTLTEGKIQVAGCQDYLGQPSQRGLWLAGLNAAFETGFANPIDQALREQMPINPASARRLDEIPYDFARKRLSVLVEAQGQRLLTMKGALDNVLQVCTHAEAASGARVPLEEARSRLEALFHMLANEGFRVLAVAYRACDLSHVTRADETGLILAGLLVLHDPPRADVVETVNQLRALGVTVKVVTGDNRVVAGSLAARAGMDHASIMTGGELRDCSDEALVRRAADTAIFAEIEPNQKERIVLALRRSGRVVGYLGDGINDATALHAADVGISVDQAVDVAKEAADIILLRHDLGVLIDGVRLGRATFANTLKYIYLATSANFGNMFSMAGISLVLPYLPLLPKQILLTNLLTDLPEMTIARDRVDPQFVEQPQRWNLRLLKQFMVVFGLLSSVFDYATFGVLLLILGADREQFRTGWFVESVISACAVVLIIRSRQPLWNSRPAGVLVGTTLVVMAVTLALPASPLGPLFGFTRLPAAILGGMLALVVLYAASAEVVKRWFFKSAKP